MDKELKLLLGRILGETYRLQRHTEGISCPASAQEIYGLINGIESAIDEEIRSLTTVSITQQDVENVENVLSEIQSDPEKFNAFTGYYDIENRLRNLNIDRGQAIRIIKYIGAEGSYKDVLDKMNSGNSPTECKKFDLRDYDI